MQTHFFDSVPESGPREGRPARGYDTVAEYFAGIGLVRLGLELAGWRVLFANDFSRDKFEMYASYFRDAKKHYSLENVHSLQAKSVPETALATSSFPCIDLSLAGKISGLNGEHSSAFWGFTRVLREQAERRPPLLLLENVPGWLSSNDTDDFRLTIQALNDLGYTCDVYAIDAVRFTPQSRQRIFVVGMRGMQPEDDIGKMLRRPTSLATNKLKGVVERHRDLDWRFLSVNPPPEKKENGLKSIIEDVHPDDPRWWDASKVKHHIEMMTPSHLDRVLTLRRGSEYEYRTIYRRTRSGEQRAEVRHGGTAGCLRTARGGSSRQIMVQAGKGRIRMRFMTPREYARLQGVPDEYPVPSDTLQALTGFGDAVCVPVITWIARNVLNPLTLKLAQAGQ